MAVPCPDHAITVDSIVTARWQETLVSDDGVALTRMVREILPIGLEILEEHLASGSARALLRDDVLAHVVFDGVRVEVRCRKHRRHEACRPLGEGVA